MTATRTPLSIAPQPDPIIVNDKAGPDQWAAAIRQTILVAAGVASAFGFSHLGTQIGLLTAVAAPAGGLVVFILGQIKTRRDSLIKTKLALIVPDSVAQVRRS